MKAEFYEQKAELEKKLTELCTEFAVAHATNVSVNISVSLIVSWQFGCACDAKVREIDATIKTIKQ